MYASCEILFEGTGGQLDSKGRPLFTLQGGEWVPVGNPLAVLNCDRAYDCGVCPHLHQWLNAKVAQGYSFGWECVRCIQITKEPDAENNIERITRGHYQAGRKFGISPESEDFDPDLPGIEGCTHVHEFDDPEVNKRAGERCGWETSFLQLVLRKRRTNG